MIVFVNHYFKGTEMRKWMLVVTMLVCLAMMPFIPSCGMSSQERVNQLQSWVDKTQEMSTWAEQQIPVLEKAIADGELMLQDPLLDFKSKQKILDELADLKVKLLEAQKIKTKADTAIAQWEKNIATLLAGGDVALGDELVLYGQGATTIGSQLPPPYNFYLGIGGLILTGIGTILGAKAGAKSQKKADEVDRVEAEKDFSTLVASVTNGLTALKNISGGEKGAEAVRTMKDAMSPIQQTRTGLEQKVAEATGKISKSSS